MKDFAKDMVAMFAQALADALRQDIREATATITAGWVVSQLDLVWVDDGTGTDTTRPPTNDEVAAAMVARRDALLRAWR